MRSPFDSRRGRGAGRLPAVALAGVLAAGCASRTPREIRQETVAEMGQIIRETRESAPHPGPKWDEIEPEWRKAAIDAATPEEYRRALVRLVDRLDDGHASVSVADDMARAFPEHAAVVQFDGEVWVGLHDGSCDPAQDLLARMFGESEVRNRRRGRFEWIRLQEIDGYRFRTVDAAVDLLRGEAGTAVELGGLDVRGREVRRTRTRTAGIPSMIGGDSIASTGDTYASAVLPLPVGGMGVAQSKRLGPDGRIGYLRVRRYEGDDSCRSWWCSSAIDRCEDRMEIAEAAGRIIDCDPIIIDLLGNRGGKCMHGSEILRHFLPPSIERIPFAHDPAPPGGTLRRWPVDDADERKARRILLLVDGGTASAAEHVAAILKGAPGVTVIGGPTAGSEYSVLTFELDEGLSLRLGGVPAIWDPGFTSAECRPVEPDVAVPIERSDLVRDGPAVAAVRRHVAILRKACEMAEAAARER